VKKNDLYAIFAALVGISLLALLKVSSLLLFMVALALWTLAWSWVYKKCKLSSLKLTKSL
jgi:hypothetical protein